MTATTLVPDLADILRQLNITRPEYDRVVEHLGREPNMTELSMFSVLWSEHCCYKNSRHLLKKLPNEGPRVLAGPGENAGVVDIGDGIQVAFKIESHNHPTAVEPYQGAATGVGGILRDIFTMNARPVANLNSLRFGPLKANARTTPEVAARNRYLFTHAVGGIGGYGNCVGVPTIGGEVFFDETYSGNPLVNAMAIGVLYDNNVTSSKAMGVGNPVLYVGSATGKDGMGGAAFASKELDEKSNEDRPAVQVGDPFAEKLLIEACLEAFATGCVVAAQDMGAAGLTSSSCEMAAKGGVGMRMDLDKVPAREEDMAAHEYLLSESQERMLFVLDKNNTQPVLDVFKKWGLNAVVVGEVIAEPNIEIWHRGEKVVDIPAALLTDLAPSYDRSDTLAEPETAKARRLRDPKADMADLQPEEISAWLQKLFASENIAAPTGVLMQYDRHVRNNTLLASESMSSGVIRLRKKDGGFSGKALAATTDCNPRHVYLDPRLGTMGAVAEAARNLACVGAEPIAVTDNLNFGNPEKPEIYYQMYHSVEGMREACLAFEIPVISGNVSLYNEHSGAAILPAPVIGMVGLIEDDSQIMSPGFKRAGDLVALVGRFDPALGGSEYQKLATGEVFAPPPEVRLDTERAAQGLIRGLIREGLVTAAQDVSMGGLLVTAIECAFNRDLGLKLNLAELQNGRRLDETLFGETHGAYLITYGPEHGEVIKSRCQSCEPGDLAFVPLGEVTAEPVLMADVLPEPVALPPLKTLWRNTLDFRQF